MAKGRERARTMSESSVPTEQSWRDAARNRAVDFLGRPTWRRACALEAARRGDFATFCRLIDYAPHEAQEQVHASRALRRVVRFGRRGGKTLLAAVEAAFVLLLPNKRVWVVAPDHSLTGRVWDEIVRILVKELGFAPTKRRDTPPRSMTFAWGSVCEGKSTEDKAQKGLVGVALDLLIWDEVAKSPGSVWERMLAPCLIGGGHRGRALLISTPEGFNHFYDFDQLGQGPDPEWASFYAPSSSNPYLPREAIEAERGRYSPEAFAQEFEALYEHFAGRVFVEWDEGRHVIPSPLDPTDERELRYDRRLPLARAFDFGVTNPFACLWLQFTPDDKLLVIDEYVTCDARGKVTREWTTEQNGRAVVAHEQAETYGEAMWSAADPAAKDARLTLRRRCGIVTKFRKLSRDKQKSVDRPQGTEKGQGIEIIRRLLREDRLRVAERCIETRREFNRYRYPERPDEVNQREEPQKIDDHCMDALRYAVGVWLCRERQVRAQAVEGLGEAGGPLSIRTGRQRGLEQVRLQGAAVLRGGDGHLRRMR